MGKTRSLYIVPWLRSEARLAIGEHWTGTVSFTSLQDGCVGVLECYTNKRKACRRLRELGIEEQHLITVKEEK